jgi:hypothetical protein
LEALAYQNIMSVPENWRNFKAETARRSVLSVADRGAAFEELRRERLSGKLQLKLMPGILSCVSAGL